MIRALILKGNDLHPTTERGQVETALGSPEARLWLDLETSPEEEILWLGHVFGFHPLAIEDCLHRNQRPKLEDYEGYLFAVLHGLRREGVLRLVTDEVHIFLSHRYLVSVHASPLEPLNRIFERSGKEPELLAHGPSFILHLLSDALVDAYFPILDTLGEEIDRLEDAVIRHPRRSRLNRLFALKRELVLLRRIINPQREVYNALSRRDYPFIDQRTALYFRDVHDHLLRASDTLDSYRDLLGSILEAYLTAASNRLNEVMKRLTIIATVFMPLSFITGFFGMNFELIPWKSRSLFLLALLAVLLLPLGMLLWFFWSGWLSSWEALEDRRRNRRRPP